LGVGAFAIAYRPPRRTVDHGCTASLGQQRNLSHAGVKQKKMINIAVMLSGANPHAAWWHYPAKTPEHR
jgi:hypothetical protein